MVRSAVLVASQLRDQANQRSVGKADSSCPSQSALRLDLHPRNGQQCEKLTAKQQGAEGDRHALSEVLSLESRNAKVLETGENNAC